MFLAKKFGKDLLDKVREQKDKKVNDIKKELANILLNKIIYLDTVRKAKLSLVNKKQPSEERRPQLTVLV